MVNYSENGVSMGTATVTFRRQGDADKAVSEYDGAEIDGKPMYCKLIGTVSSGPVVVKKKKPQQAQQQQQQQQNAVAPQLPPGFVAAGPAFNPLLAGTFAFPAAAAGGFPLQQNFPASVFNQPGFASAFNSFNQRGGGNASAYRGGGGVGSGFRGQGQQQQQQGQAGAAVWAGWWCGWWEGWGGWW